MNRTEAAAALAGVETAQQRLAGQIGTCPPWRHAVFGLVMTLLVGSAAISADWQIPGLVVAMGLMVLIVQNDRRRYGVFVNGYRWGATLPVALALLVVMGVLLAIGIRLRAAGFPLWTRLSLSVVVFAVATGASVVWNRLFVRELRRGRA